MYITKQQPRPVSLLVDDSVQHNGATAAVMCKVVQRYNVCALHVAVNYTVSTYQLEPGTKWDQTGTTSLIKNQCLVWS